MNADEMTDKLLPFLRELHDSGWDDALDALFCGIAEVEGADKGFTEEEINDLAQQLLTTVRYYRKRQKAKDN